MGRLDYKHIAFHIIVAFYFIWLLVFIALVVLTLVNFFSIMDTTLNNMLTTMIVLNLFMGTALYLVFKLFRNKSVLNKVVKYSFGFISVVSLTAVAIIKIKSF
ncbi:hypothetical protein [Flavobacterium litorale]|uniref:Uncharacterized protein n=1 Tax=Flavobacterium litorale TaxID=2856519 RepID=A0ABX8VAR2_9FLAO|nr:hypothetical protein [Flavobacterium litorale]QYJ68293.1 hypothetical protein K1I41_12335 [Flavobacterium litorale]